MSSGDDEGLFAYFWDEFSGDPCCCFDYYNFSRRRLRKSPHGLTGMCHRLVGWLVLPVLNRWTVEKAGRDDSTVHLVSLGIWR